MASGAIPAAAPSSAAAQVMARALSAISRPSSTDLRASTLSRFIVTGSPGFFSMPHDAAREFDAQLFPDLSGSAPFPLASPGPCGNLRPWADGPRGGRASAMERAKAKHVTAE